LKGFDQVFGARPLKRTIQKYLENPLAEAILGGAVDKRKPIKISADKEKEALSFTA
ncbi:MAG: hypothetical protein PHO30_03590, partial [Candidatus Omnitrophica bacterium]|nr:hypothetical protein [Candidatus Omnitrophota bacterium]